MSAASSSLAAPAFSLIISIPRLSFEFATNSLDIKFMPSCRELTIKISLAEKIAIIVIASSSRDSNSPKDWYKLRIENLILRINNEFGKNGYTVVN